MTLLMNEIDQGADASERRRGLRINQERPVKLFDVATNRFVGGETRDISATGLRIDLPIFAPVRPGKIVQVHVGPNDDGQSLANRKQLIPAKVVWVEEELG